jgi:Rieske Fe-S protein
MFTSKGAIDELTELGPLGELPVGTPVERMVTVTERLGWLSRSVEKSVWVHRSSESDLQVFTATCPHENCLVQKDANTSGFICLCHRSQFALDGAVLSGPALRGMDSLEHNVEKGVLWARFRKFKKGLKVKEVIS